jgi:hypothetical protein
MAFDHFRLLVPATDAATISLGQMRGQRPEPCLMLQIIFREWLRIRKQNGHSSGHSESLGKRFAIYFGGQGARLRRLPNWGRLDDGYRAAGDFRARSIRH